MLAARVAVLSDDPLLRHSLKDMLKSSEPSLVVGDFREVDRPDVVLLDSRMDRALTVCAELKRSSGAAVILIAAADDDRWASRAIGAGARGIIHQSASPADIVKAIAVVRDGLIWARRRVLAGAIDLLTAHPSREDALQRLLSAREREVFHHAVRGVGNKELAGSLAISEATVKVHMTRIFRKLGVQSRAELAAAYHGLRVPL